MFKGSIPALVTPMRATGALDLDAWDRLLDFHVQNGSDAVVVGGTTGESPTLERAELAELVRRARRRLDGRMPLIAGSGTNSHGQEHRACRKLAEEAGADALLVVTPYYNRPTQEGLFRHFTAIAEAVRVPVIAVQRARAAPPATCSPQTVARLSQHPRIVGIKEATGDLSRAEEILRDARPGFLLHQR